MVNLKLPPYLKSGDTLAIVATARKVGETEIKDCIDFFSQKGIQVVLGKHIYDSHFQFASTDEHRAADLQSMLDDPSVNAILCARGGYGTVRIIDQLNFDQYSQHPKWLIGFSDITVLHNQLHKLGFASVHGPMAVNFTQDENSGFYIHPQNREDLFDLISGNNISYITPPHLYNKMGTAEGNLVGGNLSVLYSLSGTSSDIDTDGKILFIEDLDEYLYHFDRMMQWLDRSGKLRKINALLIGDMIQMKNLNPDNPFGQNAEEIISEIGKKYSFPISFGWRAGHSHYNTPLILGKKVQVEINESGSRLTYE